MEKLLQRLAEIADELEALNGEAGEDGTLNDEQTERFNSLETEFTELDEQRVTMLARLVAISRVREAATDTRNVEQPIQRERDQELDCDAFSEGVEIDRSRLWDLDKIRVAGNVDLRARALSAAEHAPSMTTRDREILTS